MNWCEHRVQAVNVKGEHIYSHILVWVWLIDMYIVRETTNHISTTINIFEWTKFNLIPRYNFNDKTSLYSYVSVYLEYYYNWNIYRESAYSIRVF